MAHKGRPYKVLWRRDLCLNCPNYRRGLAEARLASMQLIRGPFPGHVFTLPQKLCRPLLGPLAGDPVWESDHFEVEGLDLRYQLETTLNFDTESWTDLVFRVLNLFATIYERTIRSGARGVCDGYLSPEFPTTPPDIYRADIWGGPWSTDRAASGSARWNVWPE